MLVVCADFGGQKVVAYDAVTHELKYEVKDPGAAIKVSKLLLSTRDPDDPETCCVALSTNNDPYRTLIHNARTGEKVRDLVGGLHAQSWAMDTIHGRPASYCSGGESVRGRVVVGDINGSLMVYDAESGASTSLTDVGATKLASVRGIRSLAPWDFPESLWICNPTVVHVFDLEKVVRVVSRPHGGSLQALEASETASSIYSFSKRIDAWDRRTFKATRHATLQSQAWCSFHCPDTHLLIAGCGTGYIEGIDTRMGGPQKLFSHRLSLTSSSFYGLARIRRNSFVVVSDELLWWDLKGKEIKITKSLKPDGFLEGCCSVGSQFDRPPFVVEEVDTFFLDRCEFIGELLPVFRNVVVREGPRMLVSPRIRCLFAEQ